MGAETFYSLRLDDLSDREFRTYLFDALLRHWPTNILVDGSVVEGIRIGQCPAKEVDHELVQYQSCAASRMLDYLLSGVIQFHLKRSSIIMAHEAAKQRARLE